MPTPNVNSPDTQAPKNGAPTPNVQAPGVNPAVRREVGDISSIRDAMSGPRGAFRSYRDDVEAAKKSFGSSGYIMNARILLGGAGAVNRGTPKTSPKGDEVVFPTLDGYRRDWDMRQPKAVIASLVEALESGKFRLVGFDNHLQKAIGLPGRIGFSEAANSLAPNKVSDYARTSMAKDYKALNLASPIPAVGDGRLVIQPVVFDTPEGRKEVFAFRNSATGSVATVNQQGNQIEVIGKVSFKAGSNKQIVREVPDDGVIATFPFNAPSEDGPAMIEAMAAKGFQPISSVPPSRGDLPPVARERGIDTMAADGLLRTAQSVAGGAMNAALGKPEVPLANELDQQMAQAWNLTKQALIQSGLRPDVATKCLGYVAPALTALANQEKAFFEAIGRDGAHKDPVFYLRDFLVDKYGLTKESTSINGVPAEKIRTLLSNRSTEDVSFDAFGAATQQETVARALKLDQIHESLIELLPDLIVRDGAGNPVRALENTMVKKPVAKVGPDGAPVLGEDGKPVMELKAFTEAVPAMWSDAKGKSDRPRFRTELDAVLGEAFIVTKDYYAAAKELDGAIQKGRLEIANRMLMTATSMGPMPIDGKRFTALAIQIANRAEVSRPDRVWYDKALKTLRDRVPALAELERTYLDGAFATAVQSKINTKEMERSAYAVGRLLEGRKPSPIGTYPVFNYAAPQFATSWISVLADNKEMTRFTGYQNKRELDGDALGSEKDVAVATNMDLNQVVRFQHTYSKENARVGGAATPRSEFVAPRDGRGFPVLTPGIAAERVITEQEQIAHAKRQPIFAAPDAFDHGHRHLFAFQGVHVEVMRGRARSAFAPGTYIPAFKLSPDGKESISRLPNSFGNLNQATDEVTFARENPDRKLILDTLVRAFPDRFEQASLQTTLDSLYSRHGRYAYPNQTFREGAVAYRGQRLAAIDVMEAYGLAVVRASRPRGVNPNSEAGAQVEATIASKESVVAQAARESRDGATFVADRAIADAERFENRKVSGLIVLLGDGAGEQSHNWMLSWESVDEMMRGERSLTALQSQGILAGRVVKSRLD